MSSKSDGLVIRRAAKDDVPAILALYNDEIEHGFATLNITPQTLEKRYAWFDAHQSARHVIFTAEKDGRFAGFVSLSVFRETEAYAPCVELSVYVAKDARGCGVGDALMDTIIAYAKSCGEINTIVSVITSKNAPSIRLHEKHGFTKCGLIPDAAVKMDMSIDVALYVLSVR